MIKNFKESPEEFKDYDSELLLKIINKTSVEIKKSDKELFVDENAAIKINGKIMPEFNHLKSLIFLLIILAIFPESLICKLTIKFMV